MLQNQLFNGSKLCLSTIVKSHKVFFSQSSIELRKKKIPDNTKKTILDNLLDELSNTKKEGELENFLEKTKAQKVASIKTEVNKSLDKKNIQIKSDIDKTNQSNQGEKFWFDLKDKITLERPPVKIHVSVTQSKTSDLDAKLKQVVGSDAELNKNLLEKVSKAPLTPLEIKSLQEELKLQGKERHISQLLSVMVDEINNGKVDHDKKFQELMKVINTKQVFVEAEHMHEESISSNQSTGDIVSLLKGESTNLFLNSVFTEIKKDNFISLFEKQKKDQMRSLLPECLPQNAFEAEMLNINQQWNFPIDNEQNMGIEDETTFDQHVFLDHLLDEFPKVAPVQKFMELVIIGLQQNPYLSVQQKEKQIFWFKEYFEKFPEDDWVIPL